MTGEGPRRPWHSRREIPDSQVRDAADQYEGARKLLEAQPPGLGVLPLLNVAAIAIELYLKCLSAETVYTPIGDTPGLSRVSAAPVLAGRKGHVLTGLFDAIPEDIRAKLEEAFRTDFTGIRRTSLRETLKLCEGLFAASRYPFERDTDVSQYPSSTIMQLSEFLGKHIAQLPAIVRIEMEMSGNRHSASAGQAEGEHPTGRPDTGERTVDPFTRMTLQREGFEGFLAVRKLRGDGRSGLPRSPGVYVVLRESVSHPEFLNRASGGWHKNRNPAFAIAALQKRWINGVSTLYIGKSTDLRRRIGHLVDFGAGKPAPHHGGRSLWQIVGAEEFVVAWKQLEKGQCRKAERSLLHKFQSTFGRLPFANLIT